VFGLSFLSYGLLLIPFLLVLFLFGIALGIFASTVVLRLGPASEWFIWPVPALISPFAGVFYPVATLPAWMQGIAHVLPPSYVFEGMRAIVAGAEFSGAYTGRLTSCSQSVRVMLDANARGCSRIASRVAAARSAGSATYVRSPKTRSLPEAKNSSTSTP